MSDPTTPATTPAGWYPDTTPGQERYWDGTAWSHTQVRPSVPKPAATPATTTVLIQPPAKKKRKWPWIVGGVVAAFILIPAIATAGNHDDTKDAGPGVTVSDEPSDEPSVEPVDTRVPIPDMTGMTVADAVAALKLVNITLNLPAEVGQDWIVTEQTVPGGEKIEPGDPLSITAKEPAPVYTLAQQNAISKAQDYLEYQGFSRDGLIGQLEYEGYSTADATFGADNSGADWNAEAAEKAKSYMEYQSFSRQGLYDQMAYEKFTDAQIQFALAQVGY